ncbi:hypothetical protein PRUPE_2G092200 [Prunus persica]|uniref:Uncharacterized protein n=1 Tax=Prunus persica TaxID=3760 RepID=A0A251QDC3_PRUPE|nr:hypothetical protein PRUPE_2G092200 [Prunus persica]
MMKGEPMQGQTIPLSLPSKQRIKPTPISSTTSSYLFTSSFLPFHSHPKLSPYFIYIIIYTSLWLFLIF